MLASPLRVPLIRTGMYGPRSPILMPGEKASGSVHEAVDCRAAVGTPVFPTVAGTVSQTITGYRSATSPGTSYGRSIFRPGGGGNQVVIRGDDGRDHNFGHLERVLVKPGQRVHLGDRIGLSGRTGVYAAHLHYGIWLEYAPNRWRSIDPTPLLPWDGDKFGVLKAVDKSASAAEEDDMFTDADRAKIDNLVAALLTGGSSMPHGRSLAENVEHARAGSFGAQVVNREVNGRATRITAVQELADAKTLLLQQHAQVAALTSAVQQLASSAAIDPAKVSAQVEAAVRDALAGLSVTATIGD